MKGRSCYYVGTRQKKVGLHAKEQTSCLWYSRCLLEPCYCMVEMELEGPRRPATEHIK